MTEVADQFTEERAGEIARISHWIDGKRVEGASGRSGPVYNPALGVQTGEVDFASESTLPCSSVRSLAMSSAWS